MCTPFGNEENYRQFREFGGDPNDENLPTMSQSNVTTPLEENELQVRTEKKRNGALIEREDIIRWRRTFITKIRDIPSGGKTHLLFGRNMGKCGRHTAARVGGQHHSSASNARERGLTIGPPTPTAKGKRLIVLHIGSEDGFVENGCCVLNRRPRALITTTNEWGTLFRMVSAHCTIFKTKRRYCDG